jgi:site-specific DNA recombinase
MIALYERVSTDEQALSGFSLEAQKQRLEAFCLSQGWTDFEHFTDDGYSGTNLERPALQKLLRAAKRKGMEGVVVYRLDRLSRRQKDVLYLLEDVFDANGIAFKSATEPFDTSTPLGRAMLGILAVFGQLERDTIIERTRSGLKQRVRQGLWSGGTFPFGYIMNTATGVLEIVPEEAELVRKSYEKFLQGESRASIQRWLEKRTTRRNINTLFVRRLLTRQTYIGKIVLNDEVFEGQHTPIIDLDTFERVQAKLKNIVIPRGGEKNLLSGLMACGVCGSGMHYWASKQKNKQGKVYRYMRVICQRKRLERSCQSKTILSREVETEVVRKLLTMPVDMEYHLPPEDSESEAKIKRLESAMDDIDNQRNNLLDAVQKGLPFDTVQIRFGELEKERKAIQETLDDIIDTFAQPDTQILNNTLKQTQKVWNDVDTESQRLLLRSIVKKVHIYPDKTVNLELVM